MDVETTALLLAWIAILLLALGMSGLLSQIHALKLQDRWKPDPPIGLLPGSAAPGGELGIFEQGSRTLVLFADTDCQACSEVVPVFADLIDRTSHDLHGTIVSRAVLTRNGMIPPSLRAVQHPRLFDAFRITAVPTVVLIDEMGAVVRTEPVGSVERVRSSVLRAQSKAEGRSLVYSDQ